MNLATIFKKYVIEPVLDHLDASSSRTGTLNSQAAINLILMIVAHESGQMTYAKQIKGPALGFIQMEPATFDWVIRWLEKSRPHLLEQLGFLCPNRKALSPEFMVVSPEFAVAMARLNLLRFPESLPEADDLEGLARYAKKYWNTSAGKATEQDYLNAYQQMMETTA
ncbi:hypothetical protein EOJ41_15140 [Vibrio alginolyticus]|uniref:hypothetical protein n=1 Tax=Vibrio alginolyticus TaxID=663 RepID=UPI00102D68D8|nr:hypothetical protein [Vibrio alginolyticus]RZV17342.1 hypothetical protein EOJ41_15140 [Vibrio alginolyticus]